MLYVFNPTKNVGLPKLPKPAYFSERRFFFFMVQCFGVQFW